MKEQENDGWDNSSVEEYEGAKEYEVKIKKDAGLGLLSSVSCSLLPDMIFGWKPKIPSCPLPLSFPNAFVDFVKKHTQPSKIVYIGRRPASSVQVNLNCTFTWKYRSRYLNSNQSPRHNPLRDSQQQYTFDSTFQNANLDLVVKVAKGEYDCYIRSDSNTKGHTNWYYFSVQPTTAYSTIQINICNFGKQMSLYTKGMKPYTKEQGTWSQLHCYDVCFCENNQNNQFNSNKLQFKYTFKNANEKVYFAYCIPYSYSQLQQFIKEVSTSKYVTSSKLCESLGGVVVPLLTISQQKEGSENENQGRKYWDETVRRRAVLITARIHPGQSHSSYLVQGFVRRLLEDDMEGIRKNMVIYVVPMLNPDGVIAGNFRTSYSGKDLNRQFKQLNKYIYPEITSLHQLAKRIKSTYHDNFTYYFDFHGHSTKKGLFCYGPQHQIGSNNYFRARVLAKTIESLSPLFLYRKSIFTISEHKHTTSRAHMLWKMSVPMSFTFEVSNGLHSLAHRPLDVGALLEGGAVVLEAFYKYSRSEMHLSKPRLTSRIIRTEAKRRKLKTLKEITQQPLFSQYIRQIAKEEHQAKVEEGGSDSEGEEEDFNQEKIKSLHKTILRQAGQVDKRKQITMKCIPFKTFLPQKQEERTNAKVSKSKNKANVSSKYLNLNASRNYRPQAKIIRRTFAYEKDKVAVSPQTFFMGFQFNL